MGSRSNSTRIFLVTHGRTTADVVDTLPPATDVPLDDIGRIEALALADTLDYQRPCRVLTSPLIRARVTAEVIATRVGLVPVDEPRLTDRDYGPWAGCRRADAYAVWPGADAPNVVESAAAVVARVRCVLDEQLRVASSGPVVIVTHHEVATLVLDSLDSQRGPTLARGRGPATWSVLIHRGEQWCVLDSDESPAEPQPGE